MSKSISSLVVAYWMPVITAASYLLSAITGFRDTPTRCASQLPKAHLGGV
ncbi:hypothetical protein CJ188_003605 [Actinomycetales bacterium UMB0918]